MVHFSTSKATRAMPPTYFSSSGVRPLSKGINLNLVFMARQGVYPQRWLSFSHSYNAHHQYAARGTQSTSQMGGSEGDFTEHRAGVLGFEVCAVWGQTEEGK